MVFFIQRPYYVNIRFGIIITTHALIYISTTFRRRLRISTHCFILCRAAFSIAFISYTLFSFAQIRPRLTDS